MGFVGKSSTMSSNALVPVLRVYVYDNVQESWQKEYRPLLDHLYFSNGSNVSDAVSAT